MLYLSETRRALLRVVALAQTLRQEGTEEVPPATLQRLAELMDMTPAAVHQQLAKLVAAGMVEKSRARPGEAPTYKLRPYFHGTWLDPERGLVLEWESRVPFDWRYPLVSRVPDAAAQHTLVRLLEAAEKKRLLLRTYPQGGPSRPKRRGPLVIVYGSCARGEAKRDSDLDILVLYGENAATRRAAWEDLAADVNLGAPRAVDLHVAEAPSWALLPSRLRRAIEDDGITVHAPYPEDSLPENDFSRSLASAIAEEEDEEERP